MFYLRHVPLYKHSLSGNFVQFCLRNVILCLLFICRCIGLYTDYIFPSICVQAGYEVVSQAVCLCLELFTPWTLSIVSSLQCKLMIASGKLKLLISTAAVVEIATSVCFYMCVCLDFVQC